MEVGRTWSPIAFVCLHPVSKGPHHLHFLVHRWFEKAPTEERLPLPGAIWLCHRTDFPSPNARLMPGSWDAKAGSLFYLRPLMSA